MSVTLDENILSHHVQIQAESRPDHLVLTFENPIYGDRQVTYGDLWKYSNRLAAIWAEQGLVKGDKVALLMRNYPEFVYALVAGSINGVVLVPIDPRTKGDKLAYQLKNADVKLVMTTGDLLPQVQEVQDRTDVKDILVYSPPGQETPAGDYSDLSTLLAEERPLMEQAISDITSPHQIIYTSGTTGDPKGIVLDLFRALAPKMLTSIISPPQPDDVYYTGLSLTHGNAQVVTCLPAIWMGNHAVISERFTKTRLWDICRKYNVTSWSNLGGIMAGIYAEPPKPNDADNPVRVITSAGTPKAIWEAFEKRFNVKILETYGAMEGGGLCVKPVDEGPIGSFGKPLDFLFEMKVVREDDTECDPHEIGELVARPVGSEAKVDYHNNEEASKKKTAGGWVRSGDMVHKDEDGWYFFDFRKGGGIRHNGDFVSPDFVERAIAEHEQVSDVFVYGVEAASGSPGERDVVAAVVPFEGVELDIASVYAKCRKDLEANFVPSYLQVVKEIPKTISEKPQERFLRAEFATDAPNVHTEPPR